MELATEFNRPAHANGPLDGHDVAEHESVEQIIADTQKLAHRKELAIEQLRERRVQITEQFQTAVKEITGQLFTLGYEEPQASTVSWNVSALMSGPSIPRGRRATVAVSAPVDSVPDAPKRRGRKPGSKNKAK